MSKISLARVGIKERLVKDESFLVTFTFRVAREIQKDLERKHADSWNAVFLYALESGMTMIGTVKTMYLCSQYAHLMSYAMCTAY